MHLQVIPPDPCLAHLLMPFMAMQLDGEDSHLPASLNPQVHLYLRGTVTVLLPDGGTWQPPRFGLCGPCPQPRYSHAAADTRFIVVSFRPGLLPDAMQVVMAELVQNMLPMDHFAPQASIGLMDQVDTLLAQQLPMQAELAAATALLQQFLLQTLNLSARQSYGQKMLTAHPRIFLPILKLAEVIGLGTRQMERQVLTYFGVPLREVRRMARFGLTLPMLWQASGRGDLTRIAHEAGYFDQAHMHREFVALAGIAPSELLDKITSADPAYWLYRMPLAQFEQLFYPMPLKDWRGWELPDG